MAIVTDAVSVEGMTVLAGFELTMYDRKLGFHLAEVSLLAHYRLVAHSF